MTCANGTKSRNASHLWISPPLNTWFKAEFAKIRPFYQNISKTIFIFNGTFTVQSEVSLSIHVFRWVIIWPLDFSMRAIYFSNTLWKSKSFITFPGVILNLFLGFWQSDVFFPKLIRNHSWNLINDLDTGAFPNIKVFVTFLFLPSSKKYYNFTGTWVSTGYWHYDIMLFYFVYSFSNKGLSSSHKT